MENIIVIAIIAIISIVSAIAKAVSKPAMKKYGEIEGEVDQWLSELDDDNYSGQIPQTITSVNKPQKEQHKVVTSPQKATVTHQRVNHTTPPQTPEILAKEERSELFPEGIDARMAIIFSEIINPKFKEY